MRVVYPVRAGWISNSKIKRVRKKIYEYYALPIWRTQYMGEYKSAHKKGMRSNVIVSNDSICECVCSCNWALIWIWNEVCICQFEYVMHENLANEFRVDCGFCVVLVCVFRYMYQLSILNIFNVNELGFFAIAAFAAVKPKILMAFMHAFMLYSKMCRNLFEPYTFKRIYL